MEIFGAGEFPAGEAPAGESGESPGIFAWTTTLIALHAPVPYTLIAPREAGLYTGITLGEGKPYTVIEVVMQTIEAGSAIPLTFTFQSGETVYPSDVDPISAEILIQKPNGDEALALTALTRLSVGRYQYVHQSLPTDPTGTWTVACKVSRNGFINWKTVEAFILVKGQAS